MSDSAPDAAAAFDLSGVPFDDPGAARRRLAATLAVAGPPPPDVLDKAVPPLLAALAGAPAPDAGLINFERFVRASAARTDKPPGALFGYLARNPRAVEILVRLFVGSQYLTDILVRNPDYLRRLTEHRQLPAYKSRGDFLLEALSVADAEVGPAARLDALRRYQHWELLRIGACDTFGLLDLRSVTAQLSLLADAFTQSCLNLLSAELGVDGGRFCVLAFGKLGGEELNYSSDIDLAFLAEEDATKYWTLGQRLIKALSQATGEGFLYRVDMRLRPWGQSGPLVNTPEAHLAYLKKHGRVWERQALLKARPIAGNLDLGRAFLHSAEPLIYGTPPDAVRASVRESKARIEADLKQAGREWGEVKSGAGSIRDIEFTTQCLQLVHGGEQPGVRAAGTLNALARLGRPRPAVGRRVPPAHRRVQLPPHRGARPATPPPPAGALPPGGRAGAAVPGPAAGLPGRGLVRGALREPLPGRAGGVPKVRRRGGRGRDRLAGRAAGRAARRADAAVL